MLSNNIFNYIDHFCRYSFKDQERVQNAVEHLSAVIIVNGELVKNDFLESGMFEPNRPIDWEQDKDNLVLNQRRMVFLCNAHVLSREIVKFNAKGTEQAAAEAKRTLNIAKRKAVADKKKE